MKPAMCPGICIAAKSAGGRKCRWYDECYPRAKLLVKTREVRGQIDWFDVDGSISLDIDKLT